MKLAVYDIGTNSIHLLIVRIKDDFSFEVVDHEKDFTRLGHGSFESNTLSREAIARTCRVLKRFGQIVRKSGVRKVIGVATSAVRQAQNGQALVEAARRSSGLRVRVISGQEEARLVFIAALSSVETNGRRTLAIDIGGGSAELVVGDRDQTNFTGCYPLGVARLTETYLRHDPPTKKDLRRLEKAVDRQLGVDAKKIRRLHPAMTIGTAGTIINLASMISHERFGRPLQFVNHFQMRRRDLEKLCRKLLRSSKKDRLNWPGLDPLRADLIVAGAVLVGRLFKLLKIETLTLSDRGIREGLVVDYIEKNRKKIEAARAPRGLRLAGVMALARRSAYDKEHSHQVARLAEQLFDRTKRLHRLGRHERELLGFAAILHDIGYSISYRKHHQHSYYLIVNSELAGFTPDEVETIGLAARCHRKRVGRCLVTSLCALSRSQERIARVLGAILRLADALDRGHFSVVKSLRCRIGRKELSIRFVARQDADLEIWQAKQRSDLLEEVFGRLVTIERQR